jgi:hypothetical protein
LLGEFWVDFKLDAHRDIPRLKLILRHLMGAIWLQSVLAVMEGKNYRNCEICGTPFDTGEFRKLTCPQA